MCFFLSKWQQFSHTTQPKAFYVDLQSTSHCRTFSIGTHTTVKVRLQEIVGSDRSLQKYQTSIDGPIPFTSEAHFRSHDVLWQGQTKSNEGFLGPMEKGFPLVSEGDGAVVRALRTQHCFVTCDAVLIFFAVPKTTVNYFLRNWNTKLAKFFTSFVCLV